MKVWCVFNVTKIPNDSSLQETLIDERWLTSLDTDALFAFSKEKELVDRWLQFRKKKYFKVVKFKMSKAEYMRFANQQHNQMLSRRYLVTRDPDDPSSSIEVEVSMTDYDYNTLTDILSVFACDQSNYVPEMIFQRKYEKALHVLFYDFMANLDSQLLALDVSGDLNLGEYPSEIQMDELMVYLDMRKGDFIGREFT